MKNRDATNEIKNINVLGNAMKTYTEYINNLIKEVVEDGIEPIKVVKYHYFFHE